MLSFAGLMSANQSVDSTNEFVVETTISGGYCSIDIYRVNSDGVHVFVRSVGGWAESEAACEAKAARISARLEAGADPNSISYYF